MSNTFRFVAISLVVCFTVAAEAVDGVVPINQELALAGGITPGDDPGFPVRITRAGSYRLSGNLRVLNPIVNAVEVKADNVTLDLNGFTIQGPWEQCFNRLAPVWCAGETSYSKAVVANHGTGAGQRHSNTVVVNGTVRGMDGSGLILGYNARVERLHVTRNRIQGITALDGSIIATSIVASNGGVGIFGQQSRVVGNVIHGNASFGILVGYYQDNLIFGNNSGLQQASGIDVGGNICEPGPCS